MTDEPPSQNSTVDLSPCEASLDNIYSLKTKYTRARAQGPRIAADREVSTSPASPALCLTARPWPTHTIKFSPAVTSEGGTEREG